jgi:hypothetical protein
LKAAQEETKLFEAIEASDDQLGGLTFGKPECLLKLDSGIVSA